MLVTNKNRKKCLSKLTFQWTQDRLILDFVVLTSENVLFTFKLVSFDAGLTLRPYLNGGHVKSRVLVKDFLI